MRVHGLGTRVDPRAGLHASRQKGDDRAILRDSSRAHALRAHASVRTSSAVQEMIPLGVWRVAGLAVCVLGAGCGSRTSLLDLTREGAGLSAPDSSTGRAATHAILFGGDADGVDLGSLSDTWAWNGVAWTEIRVAGPTGRSGAVAAPLNGALVLFGARWTGPPREGTP
jgi:hypothetical protein